MKKLVKFLAVCSALVLGTISFVGCGGKNITVYTGGTGGAYYGFTNAIAPMLKDKTGINFTVVGDTGGSVANIKAINKGDAKLAIVQNDTMINAYNGLTNNFSDGAIKSFSVVAQVYPEVMQIVTNKSNINSLADLIGSNYNVSIGDVGSGVEANAVALLTAYGVDIQFDSVTKKYTSTDITIHNLSVGLSADGMKNQTIDVFFFTSGAPASAITSLAANSNQLGVKMVGLSDQIITNFISDNKIDDQYDVYSKVEITNSNYDFISVGNPVATVGVTATYICSNSLSDDDVYSITKAIFDSKDELVLSYALAVNMDASKATAAIGNVPVHAGAARYYEELSK